MGTTAPAAALSPSSWRWSLIWRGGFCREVGHLSSHCIPQNRIFSAAKTLVSNALNQLATISFTLNVNIKPSKTSQRRKLAKERLQVLSTTHSINQ